MDSEIEAFWSRPISKLERAFFSSLKWILVAILLGSLVIIGMIYMIQNNYWPDHYAWTQNWKDTKALVELVMMMCTIYVCGIGYRWFRLKYTKKTAEANKE